MLPLFVVIVVLATFDLLVLRYGADSRDGNDWALRKPTRRSPSIG